MAWAHDTDFASQNRTAADAAWSRLDSNGGSVALSDEYVSEKGLPTAQRWPWDATKGIYLLHGYHNLHCLVGQSSRNVARIDRSEHRTRSVPLFWRCMTKNPRAVLSAISDIALTRSGKTLCAMRTILQDTQACRTKTLQASDRSECAGTGISLSTG